MQKITIFGKGGIGKSTLSGNLAAVYAKKGLKVILVGCDPKHDTTIALTDGRPIRTVVEHSAFMDSAGGDLSKILVKGRLGVDCVEAGGPEPGIGCAGRGIGRTITILEEAGVLQEGRYDVAIFDVLGDVVCGGFAAPLRQGFADKVVIVTSEELMALYAANNIARAIRNYSENGVALCGLVANLRDPDADRAAVERFAASIGTGVLSFFTRESAVREAEFRRTTLVEHAPDSELARKIGALADGLLRFERRSVSVPEPLSDESFNELSRRGFAGAQPEAPAAAPAPRPEPRAPAPPPAPAPGPKPDLEKDMAWQAKLWEGNPGMNSQVWGAEDQWRRFFCDFETRRNVRMSLEGGTPLVNVWHQDLECSYSTPNYEDRSLPAFYKFPWPRMERGDEEGPREDERPKRGRRRKDEDRDDGNFSNIMTNIKDLDVIHGGGKKLDEALAEAIKNAKGGAEAIVVHSTCIPTVIGDDAEAVVKRWQARTKVPIVYMNHAESSCQELDVCLSLFKKMQQGAAFAKVRRAARSVNLVGFPSGPGLKELVRLLEETGLSVNACVMPSLSLAVARRYLAAEAQILYPNAAYAETYKEYFEPMPIKTFRPDAPYGFEGTRKWLEAVAGEFGLKSKVKAVYARAAKDLTPAWTEGRREASSQGLAFVVDANHVPRLADPGLTWGIPVLRLLREMGFGVEILCFGQERRQAEHFTSFRTPEELATLLAEGPFQAVYSEYAYDTRLARAGKAQFSLEGFEMGLGGAVRTLQALNTLCRWPFQRRYAKYMGDA
ncbi:MAG: AAA family ATPase [Elusimicrobia bacterium]|nr:AAA family ATPase [Elusimicrobiota bacterium]